MKNFFIKIIIFYQEKIHIFKKPSCMFFPTCSEYAKEAIRKYGLLKGIYLGCGRILRCHPWQKNHLDPLK